MELIGSEYFNIGSVHAMIKLILILIIFLKDKYVIQGGAEKG